MRVRRVPGSRVLGNRVPGSRAGRVRGRRLGVLLAATLVVSGLSPTLLTTSSAGAATPAVAHPKGYDATLKQAITDIQAYWKKTFPKVYGDKYIPMGKVVAAHPGTALPACQGQKLGYADVKGNAFYCFKSNFIAYDDADLLPSLAAQFGNFSVAIVLAHEWGHAIQDRAGNAGEQTIYKELQADCFAGAWTQSASNGEGKVKLQGADLENAIAALLELRDPTGSSAEDDSAHGSAFDRVGAFQDGFLQGPAQCATYFTKHPVVVEGTFSTAAEAASGGNLPAAEVIPTTIDLLNSFYKLVEPKYQPISIKDFVKFDSSKASTIPKCGGSKLAKSQVENRVFLCISDGYFGFDEPFLQDVYDNIGDFAVASLIASPVATYVQKLQGVPGVDDNTLAAVLQADCYSGGWTAALALGNLPQGQVLSPGDLDEFVQAFLVYSRARGVSTKIPITFVRIAFFRQGFFQGYRSCDTASITAEVNKL